MRSGCRLRMPPPVGKKCRPVRRFATLTWLCDCLPPSTPPSPSSLPYSTPSLSVLPSFPIRIFRNFAFRLEERPQNTEHRTQNTEHRTQNTEERKRAHTTHEVLTRLKILRQVKPGVAVLKAVDRGRPAVLAGLVEVLLWCCGIVVLWCCGVVVLWWCGVVA